MADRTKLELATSAVTGRSFKNETLIDSVFASIFIFLNIVYMPLYMLNTLKYGHKKGTVRCIRFFRNHTHKLRKDR